MENFPKTDQVIDQKEKILIYSKTRKPSKSYSDYTAVKKVFITKGQLTKIKLIVLKFYKTLQNKSEQIKIQNLKTLEIKTENKLHKNPWENRHTDQRNRQPRNKPMYRWFLHLQQRSAEYIMEKDNLFQ